MKRIIFFSLVFILVQPVVAEVVSPDQFVINYDPKATYETTSGYVDSSVKNHMYKDDIDTNPKEKLSHELESSRNSVPFILPSMYADLVSEVKKIYKRLFLLISRHVLVSAPKKKILKPKNYSVLVPNIPFKASSSNGWYSSFSIDPYSESIPQAVKEVYTWDRLWNPSYNPQHYLQCTAYVAMIYNLNGRSLKGKIHGDAKDWISLTETFTVYESGKTTETPRPLDIMVWAGNGANHVGVVSEVTPTSVTIINSNSSSSTYTFTIKKNMENITTITNLKGESASKAWVPSHWLRIK